MGRNDTVADVKDAGDKKEIIPFSADGTKAPDVVRFWSTQSGYTIAVAPGKNVVFKNHVLVLESNDPRIKNVRDTQSYEVKEVLDKPFESDADLAKFNKYLQILAYNSETGKTSKRGKIAIMGLFSLKDDVRPDTDTDLLIVKALKTKSFKEGI